MAEHDVRELMHESEDPAMGIILGIEHDHGQMRTAYRETSHLCRFYTVVVQRLEHKHIVLLNGCPPCSKGLVLRTPILLHV